MRFLQPQFLKLFYLLLAAVLLWIYALGAKRRARLKLGGAAPLRKISRFSSLWRECGRNLLLTLLMAALILALARPQLASEKRVPEPIKMDIVFLLDTSPSMRAADIPPSRLDQALEVIGNASRKKLARDRIALVSFAAGSLILSYLTEDPENILYYLDYLKQDTAVSMGTNIGGALKNGLSVIAKELEISPEAAQHKKVFILLSDGEDHGRELEAAVRAVKRERIKVHTVGIGSAEGAPIPIGREDGRIVYLADDAGNRIISRFDERALKWVAEETGGKAYRSFTARDIETALADILTKERDIEGYKRVVEHQDIYHGFLLAAFGILLTAMLV